MCGRVCIIVPPFWYISISKRRLFFIYEMYCSFFRIIMVEYYRELYYYYFFILKSILTTYGWYFVMCYYQLMHLCNLLPHTLHYEEIISESYRDSIIEQTILSLSKLTTYYYLLYVLSLVIFVTCYCLLLRLHTS